ncbi:polymer-forming cytoskeletal protein [Actinomycetes bacterium NPDC127524]
MGITEGIKVELAEKGILEINGYGSSNGGVFRSVHVNGRGTVNGDIECGYLECNGSGTFKGNIVSKKTRISGHSTMDGEISGNELKAEGNAKIKKNVQVEILKVSGNGTFGANVRADSIVIEGRASIAGNCDAEDFYVQGNVKIQGQLNAEKIAIEPFGHCQIAEIGGQSISVKYHHHFFLQWLKPFFNHILTADIIEGDDIALESTKAKIVRGRNVKIGKGCEIGLVEYSGVFEQEEASQVKESRKV